MLSELLELVDDEENFVKMEGVTALSQILAYYKREDILKAEVLPALANLYNDKYADSLLEEVADVMISNSGKILYSVGKNS